LLTEFFSVQDRFLDVQHIRGHYAWYCYVFLSALFISMTNQVSDYGDAGC
jgi:hypothetical protein